MVRYRTFQLRYHRVKRYLQYTFSDTTQQLDTSIMNHISESLKAELKCVTIGAQLQHFELFAHTSSKTLAKLAALCEELIFTVSEMIEAAGQTASGLSIVIQGYVAESGRPGRAQLLAKRP